MENSKLKGTREFSRDKVPMSRLTAAGVLNAVLFFQYYILPYSVLYCITESRSLCLPLSFFLLFSLFFFSPVYFPSAALLLFAVFSCALKSFIVSFILCHSLFCLFCLLPPILFSLPFFYGYSASSFSFLPSTESDWNLNWEWGDGDIDTGAAYGRSFSSAKCTTHP